MDETSGPVLSCFFSQNIKETFPKTPLVLDGIYAALCYEHARQHAGAFLFVAFPECGYRSSNTSGSRADWPSIRGFPRLPEGYFYGRTNRGKRSLKMLLPSGRPLVRFVFLYFPDLNLQPQVFSLFRAIR